MKEQLQNYLNRYVEFDEKEIDIFYSHLTSKKFNKKEYLFRESKSENRANATELQ